MKFNVLVALTHLNKKYDGFLAFTELCLDMEMPAPHFVAERAKTIVEHDRILSDMVMPIDRPAEREFHQQKQREQIRRIQRFFSATFRG